MLCEGFQPGEIPIIGHGDGPEYDEGRMNRPLNEDPDDTGVRAALEHAKIHATKEEATAAHEKDPEGEMPWCQHEIWQLVAGCLKIWGCAKTPV